MDVYETPLLEPLLLIESRTSETSTILCTDHAEARSSEAQQQSCSDQDDETDLLMQLFGIPYIRSCQFWRKFAANTVIGFIIGCVTAAFFTLIHLYKIGPVSNVTVPSEHNYLAFRSSSTETEKLGLWEGNWRWLLTTISGSILATFILALRPEVKSARNLFMEIRNLDPDLAASPFKLLSCLIALLSGASIGPEAFLSTVGCALGSLSAKSLRLSSAERKCMILSGIAGALGVIFPSPFIGILCVVELSIVTSRDHCIFSFEESSDRPCVPLQENNIIDGTMQKRTENGYHNFMEQITLMGVTASVAFVTVTSLNELRPSLVADIGSFDRAEVDHTLQIYSQVAYSALLGCLCGVVGSLYLILHGLFRNIAQRASKRLLHRYGMQKFWLVTLMFPLFSGVIYGSIAVAYPLTLGSGHEFIGYLLSLWKQNASAKFIQNGPDEVLTANLLLISGLLKLLTTATCLGFGMFGGQIIPLVVAGVYLGFASAFYVPLLSVPLSVACCSVGIVGSFVPIPFTLVVSVTTSRLADVSAVPVFVSVLCAFSTNAGLGAVVEIAKRKSQVVGHNDPSERNA